MFQRLVHFADLFEDVWKTFTDAVQKTICVDSSVPSLVPDVLKQLPEQLEEGTVPGTSARDLIVQVVKSALDQCASLMQTEEAPSDRVKSLVGILDAFGEHVFADAEVAQVNVARTWNVWTVANGFEASR